MIVVDVAIVVDLLTQAQGADEIGQRLSGVDIHAPHLLDTEVVSALRGLVLELHDNVTAYDAAHLALAGELECVLLTRDARLGRAPAADVVVEVI